MYGSIDAGNADKRGVWGSNSWTWRRKGGCVFEYLTMCHVRHFCKYNLSTWNLQKLLVRFSGMHDDGVDVSKGKKLVTSGFEDGEGG